MNEHHQEILFYLNRTQLTGLGCLAFLAIREKSTLEYQWKEWGFTDLTHETILGFNQLNDAALLELATAVATHLSEDLTTNEKAIA